MDQAGLRCISTHHSMSDLSPHLDELIEYGHNLGLTYIVCPSPTRKDPSARESSTSTTGAGLPASSTALARRSKPPA
jgi:hypothetical protein